MIVYRASWHLWKAVLPVQTTGPGGNSDEGSMTKAQAFAQGITLCRWRNMRYRTERGKLRLAAYRRNAACASRAHKRKHRPCVVQPEPVTPAAARILNYAPIRPTPTSPEERAITARLKQAQLKLRQLKIERHCAQMRAVHSANAAARHLLQKQLT